MTTTIAVQETWGGEGEVEDFDSPNIWIGPHHFLIIRFGALFAPCMRDDERVAIRVAQWDAFKTQKFGCCELPGIGAGKFCNSDLLELHAH